MNTLEIMERNFEGYAMRCLDEDGNVIKGVRKARPNKKGNGTPVRLNGGGPCR